MGRIMLYGMRRPFLRFFAIVCISISAFFCFQYYIRPPTERFDFVDCTIGVLGGDGTIIAHLDQDDTDEFLDILANADLGPQDGSFLEHPTIGWRRSYRVFLRNGKTVDIFTMADYLVIDDMCYKCDQESRAKIDVYYQEVYREVYPIGKTAS